MTYTRLSERTGTTSDTEVMPELFRRFLAGDDAAFTALYEFHNQRLFAYCAKILGDHAAAKDIVHTMWEKIIAMRKEPSEIKNPTGFFLRVARNLCLDHRKHLHYQKPLEEVPEGDHPVHSGMNENEELVIEALQELHGEAKEILVLHYYSGYSFEEIAVMLGKSPNAIWTKASRARNDLKKAITKKMNLQTTVRGMRI